MREVTKTVLEMFPGAELYDLNPIPILNEDSLLDLLELGYTLGRHKEYNHFLAHKRRERLKEHLDVYLKTK